MRQWWMCGEKDTKTMVDQIEDIKKRKKIKIKIKSGYFVI